MGAASFIPAYISDRVVIRVYQFLAWVRVPGVVRKKNYTHNLEYLPRLEGRFWEEPSGYIENQQQWGDIRFGAGPHHNMCYSGCEIIASCNAWKAIKGDCPPEAVAGIIRDYEMHGAALWGEFGVSPRAIERFFKKKGFTVSSACGDDQAAVEAVARRYCVMTATVYNDRTDIMKQIHTVCITKNEKQEYILHNAYLVDKNGRYVESAPYKTLMEAVRHISRHEPKLICLIGIAG